MNALNVMIPENAGFSDFLKSYSDHVSLGMNSSNPYYSISSAVKC
jgi:hypothetical protein